MQKWEYLFLEFIEVQRDQGRVTANGESLGKKTKQAFFAYCSQLGHEGYELVSMTRERDIVTLALKRLWSEPL